MSKAGDIFDLLVTQLDTLYPSGSGYQRLAFVRDPDENNFLEMKKGYGLAFDTAILGRSQELSNRFNDDLTALFIFTREVRKLTLDRTGKDSVEKELLEDVTTLRKDIRANNLGLTGTANLVEFNQWLMGDVFANKKSFKILTAQVTISYTESAV